MSSPNPSSSPPLSKTTAEEEQRDTSSANVDGPGDDKDADTEEEKIFVPRKYDVLFGRGRPLQDHPGNLRFHRIINRARASYVSSRKEDKFRVASDVMHEIRTRKENPESEDNPKKESDGDDDTNSPSSGGEPARFLKKVSDANTPTGQVYWIEVPDDLAVEKISHALRGRPRSEIRNRRDSSGSGKNVGSGRRRRGSKNNEYEPSGMTAKRKGPPSPPSNETQSDIIVGTNNADAVFQFNANASTHIPTSENQNVGNQSLDNNQIQSIAAALNFQQIGMKLQQENAQKIAEQQLLQQSLLLQSLLRQSLRQQLVNPQQTTIASAVNAISAVNPSGQNQPAQLSSGMAVGLPVQQLQLLLQQQQAMQLGQQQSLQHQQAIQYMLQQNQLQAQPPQESQSQQEQKPSTAQQSQQANRSTTSSSPGLATPTSQINTGRGTAIDLISVILEASGINTSNPNVLSSSNPNMIAQQPPGVPPQNLPTMIPQPAGGRVAAASDLQGDQQFQQLQQYFLQILQSHQALFAALNPQQPLQPQSFSTIPSLSSSTTVPAPQLGIGQLPQHLLQILQPPQALLPASNPQQASLPQNLTTAPNASSSTTDAPQNQPQQPDKKAPPSNKPP